MRRRPAALSQDVVAGMVVLLDASAVLAAVPCVNLVRTAFDGAPFSPPPGLLLLAAGLLVLSYHAVGLYRFNLIARPKDHAKKAVCVGAGVALALMSLDVSPNLPDRLPRGSVFLWMMCALAIGVGLRFAVATSLRRLATAGHIGRRIVIYGAGAQGVRLIQRIKALNEPWNVIVGVFDERSTRREQSISGHAVCGGLQELLHWGRRNRPDEILIALPWSAEDRIFDILHQLAVLPTHVRLASEVPRFHLIEGRSNTQFGLPMLNAFEKPIAGWGRIWKRIFDVALAGVAIVAAAPLLMLIALLIRLESPGPILFAQPRFGFNNKLINVFKFRSMRSEASDALGERLTERGDSRVTRVGAVLRRYSLDELPQLLNVLLGEMSLVGPRPHAIRTTAGGKQCDAILDQYAVRHKVKPGITGWAQINGWRGTMETEHHLVKRVEHDLFYINHWSPLLDIKILLLTVWAVFNGSNSY